MNVINLRSCAGLLLLLAIALTALPTYAQPGRMDPEARIQQMVADLGITEEQMPAFRKVMDQINANQQKMREEMSSGAGGDRQAMMERVQASRAESEKLLATVLTDAQMTKYREQQAARMRQFQR